MLCHALLLHYAMLLLYAHAHCTLHVSNNTLQLSIQGSMQGKKEYQKLRTEYNQQYTPRHVPFHIHTIHPGQPC
jgi:hypothetical protein